MTPRRGEIYRVDLNPVVGSETAKVRPCVIVQRDSANASSPTTIVCPLTDAGGKTGNLLNVFVAAGDGGTTKDSLVVCNQVRVVDTRRLMHRDGALTPETMTLIARGLRAILDLS